MDIYIFTYTHTHDHACFPAVHCRSASKTTIGHADATFKEFCEKKSQKNKSLVNIHWSKLLVKFTSTVKVKSQIQ